MVYGYTGYNKVKGIKRCACYAHIRRYFNDAIPKGGKNDKSLSAVQGFEYCNRLFDYERTFKERGCSYEQIKEARNNTSRPVVEAFVAWLEKQHSAKGTKLAAAVNYALKRREDMFTYMEDGRCSASNNLSEQKMKKYVIGRKGWLFSDSVDGRNASAVAYSMVEMANEN